MHYKVNEIFQSIQGEGIFTGTPANFIRLSGCNLSCEWCDTHHTPHEEMTVEQIVSKLEPSILFVVITGGEPTLQDLSPLCKALKGEGYYIAIETNGTAPFDPIHVDWTTVSPKAESGYVINCRPNEIKYVVDETFDTRVINRNFNCLIYLSPEGVRPEMIKKAYDIVMQNPGFMSLGVQLHKLIGVR